MTMTVFGYLILISVDFYYLISSFSPQFWLRFRRYIKHSRQCFTTFPNTLKFVKNSPLRTIFSTLFSVLGNVVKHGLSYLIYYFLLLLHWRLEQPPQHELFCECLVFWLPTRKQHSLNLPEIWQQLGHKRFLLPFLPPDGWSDRWMEAQMDGWTNVKTNRQ